MLVVSDRVEAWLVMTEWFPATHLCMFSARCVVIKPMGDQCDVLVKLMRVLNMVIFKLDFVINNGTLP